MGKPQDLVGSFLSLLVMFYMFCFSVFLFTSTSFASIEDMLLQCSSFERASRSLAETGLYFRSFGLLWALLGSLWGSPGLSWGLLGLSGPLLWALGGPQVVFWVSLGSFLAPLGYPWTRTLQKHSNY